MPPTLHLFLALQAGVQTRDTEGIRQGLRHVATTLPEDEGLRLTQMLSASLDPQGRFWLANLLGPRLAVPES